MQRMAGCFKINSAEGNEIDRFEFMSDGNHGVINNRSGCLFSGYYLEAVERWGQIKKDMTMCEILGHTIEIIK